VLEQILLDNSGVPFVRFTPNGTIVPQQSYNSNNTSGLEGQSSSFPPPNEIDTDEAQTAQTDKSSSINGTDRIPISDHVALDPSLSVGGTLKRKADQLSLTPSLHFPHNEDVTQCLPSQDILIELVDQFCLSFHHWIPYLHKARSQNEVRKPTISPKFNIVLHAIVATGLRRLNNKNPLLSDGDLNKQITVSKMLVMRQAMSEVSLEGLQALLFLVFDDVSANILAYLAVLTF
jgi:hypothetical protein